MATNPNVINDLGTVTKLPNKVLDTLVSKLDLCIGSAIHDAILNKEDIAILNIGIGSLSVSLTDMQCKFIPSKDLKAAIKRSIEDGVDPVEFELEQALIAKLTSICEEEL